jgi:shikimate dehydrogenase
MKCAVVGDPVAHSLSPVLHRAGYAALGLDWTYDAHRVPQGSLIDFVAAEPDWRGLSVTMPLKREALLLASSASDRARRVGAANTLVQDSHGIRADNTDIVGASAALREKVADLGVTSIHLLVRDPDRALETFVTLMEHPAKPRVQLGDLASDRAVGEVLVSTIPATAQSEVLLERCAEVPVVFEVLYDPWPTPLARSASDRVLVTGLDLLVHQAAEQFRLFTGELAPLAEMRSAGEQALAARRS